MRASILPKRRRSRTRRRKRWFLPDHIRAFLGALWCFRPFITRQVTAVSGRMIWKCKFGKTSEKRPEVAGGGYMSPWFGGETQGNSNF